jgi:MFS family permease
MLLALNPDITWLVAVPAFGIAGLGMGLAYSPLALIVLRESAVAAQGASTSALSLTDSVGTALGTGITGAIVAASVRANGQPAAGLAVAFTVAIAIGLVGLSLTRRLRPRTAAATSLSFSAASPPP